MPPNVPRYPRARFQALPAPVGQRLRTARIPCSPGANNASTAAPRTRRLVPIPAPCRRRWSSLALRRRRRSFRRLRDTARPSSPLGTGQGRRPWAGAPAARDWVGIAHARTVTLGDVAGFEHALDDRTRARVGVIDDRAAV